VPERTQVLILGGGVIGSGRFETLDLTPLSRERFEDPHRWLREELHI